MKGIRLIAMVAAVLLALAAASVALGAQDEGEGRGAASTAAEAESLSDRIANSETLTLPDGQLETRIYPDPVNYRDEEGNWRPIGERLRESDEQTLTNGPNAFDVSGPSEESLGCMIEPWECPSPPVPRCEDGDGDLLGEHPVDLSCEDSASDSGSAQPALDPDLSSSATGTSSPSGSLYENNAYEMSAEQQITANKRRRAALTRCRKLGGKARARCRTHASQIGRNHD